MRAKNAKNRPLKTKKYFAKVEEKELKTLDQSIQLEKDRKKETLHKPYVYSTDQLRQERRYEQVSGLNFGTVEAFS